MHLLRVSVHILEWFVWLLMSCHMHSINPLETSGSQWPSPPQSYPTRSWERSTENLEWFALKSIHYCFDPDCQENHWKNTNKEPERSSSLQKNFDSIHRGNTEQILLACVIPKEIVNVIMEFMQSYKILDTVIRRRDFWTLFFGKLQRDVRALYFLIISLDNVWIKSR